MGALRVKLVASLEGRNESQRGTITGLGLRKINDERILKDTPAIRGMVAKVGHMVIWEPLPGEAPKRERTKRAKSAAKSAAPAAQK
jgi:large subunit ribosomal protein L30